MPKLMQLFCKKCEWKLEPGAAHCNTSKCPLCGEQAYIKTIIICPKCHSNEAVVLTDTSPEIWECFACDYIFFKEDL